MPSSPLTLPLLQPQLPRRPLAPSLPWPIPLHNARIVSVHPSVICSRPDLTLSPKLYFLSSCVVRVFLISSTDCLASSPSATSPVSSLPTSPPSSAPTSASSSPMASLPLPSPPSSPSNPAHPHPLPFASPKSSTPLPTLTSTSIESAMFVHAIPCRSPSFPVPIVGCEEEGEAATYEGGVEIGDDQEREEYGEGEREAVGGVMEVDGVGVEGVAGTGVVGDGRRENKRRGGRRREKKLF